MRQNIRNFWKYRDLFFQIIKKDISIKYRNSFLGIIWSMLNPLLMMVVLTIIFSSIFKNQIPHFPVYVLIGRIVYQFFAESTNFAMDSIHVNAQLIRKVYVPKYFFPLSRIFSSFITTLISMIPILLVMVVTGIPFRWLNLLVIFPLIYLLFVSIGMGLILSAVNVFFRDMKHLYSIILLMLMYMTPIFYPAEIIPEKYMFIIQLNPLFDIVQMFRDVMINNVVPNLSTHLVSLSSAVVYCLIGVIVFYKSQDRFIYHI